MVTFAPHSLRIRFQPSEGSALIDLTSMKSLELIQNNRLSKSNDCLFGLLHQTLTPMGTRLLRSNILQPLTDKQVLDGRLDALNELAARGEIFFAVRKSLKVFLDVDRLLTALIKIPTKASLQMSEQAINNIIVLKQTLNSIGPLYEALIPAECNLLQTVRGLLQPSKYQRMRAMINSVINSEVTFQKSPLDLRNQRCYAVQSGINGLLDVARQTYKEATADVYHLTTALSDEHSLPLDLRFEAGRGFYLRLNSNDIDSETPIPSVFVNIIKRKKYLEFQTLAIMKMNVKIDDALTEVILMSTKTVNDLTDDIRSEIGALFQISEAVAILDMLAGFAQLTTTASSPYTRPEFTANLAIKDGRHPVKETILPAHTFVPNDIFASPQSRLQLITGANNSGKSTYIMGIPLLSIMAQVGCFVPATFATLPIFTKLMCLSGSDDTGSANMSGFAAEMSRMAFVIGELDQSSLFVVDELGRATSSRDGLAIALAVAEFLLTTQAVIFFSTHHRPSLPAALSLRPGVVNIHFESISRDGVFAPRFAIAKESRLDMSSEKNGDNARVEHYGITTASMLLPAGLSNVLQRATEVSDSIRAAQARQTASSSAVRVTQRRKTVLELVQGLRDVAEAREKLDQEALGSWLQRMQRDFVINME
jgi:DNA mismatch repair protein MSH4